MPLFEHHKATIDNIIRHFQADPEIQALVLAGSIAHGYARPSSDVDIVLFLDQAAFDARWKQNALNFQDSALCTYSDGYIDGKYSTISFLRQVAERGSDPAKYAFQDAVVLFSRIPELQEAITSAARYPRTEKNKRIARFLAQLEAWHWYAHEAIRHENRYLLTVACSKLVLFGVRLILTHNELLYPYHKWMLRVLDSAHSKPPLLAEQIETLLADPSSDSVDNFFHSVRTFQDWPVQAMHWPTQFIFDSELNWLREVPPIEDL